MQVDFPKGFSLDASHPIDKEIDSSDEVRVYELKEVPTMGVVRHLGSYEQLGEAYAARNPHWMRCRRGRTGVPEWPLDDTEGRTGVLRRQCGEPLDTPFPRA